MNNDCYEITYSPKTSDSQDLWLWHVKFTINDEKIIRTFDISDEFIRWKLKFDLPTDRNNLEEWINKEIKEKFDQERKNRKVDDKRVYQYRIH